MARALPRPAVGPRQGARHALQHGRRAAHGDRDRRAALRPVDGLPLHAHRRRRAAPRRPQAHRQDEPPVVSLRRAGQRARAGASSTRARTSSSTPTPSSAASSSTSPRGVALPDLRPEGRRTCSRAATRRASPSSPTRWSDAGRAAARRPRGVPARRSSATTPPSRPGALRPDGARTGSRTRGLDLPKSNWAQRLDTPPFVAYPGDRRHHVHLRRRARERRSAQVHEHARGQPIPGLYACGEMVGGLFHGNYPGGTGLMSGAVFGRIAGAGRGRPTSSHR